MSNGLASVEPDGPLYRLSRDPDPWVWPDWSYAAPDGTFGNRYDDPHGSYRVLYASSQRLGAFLETLARFRPDLEVLAELERIEGDDEPLAGVPRTGLEGRLIGEATVEGRFVDVGDSASLGHAPSGAGRERDSPRPRRDRRGDNSAARTASLHAARLAVRLRAGLLRRHPLPLAAGQRRPELGGPRVGS